MPKKCFEQVLARLLFVAVTAAYSLAACLSFPDRAMAIPTQTITANERSLLPKWCMLTQTFDSDRKRPGRYNTYLTRYGPGWSHAHHICWSMVAMQRYRQANTTVKDRDYLAKSAVGDLNYVLANAPPNFFMRFDIHYQKAKILLLEKKYRGAAAVAREMISQWPDRADSYGVLAQVLFDQGKTSEARKVLDQAESKIKDKNRLDRYRKVLVTGAAK